MWGHSSKRGKRNKHEKTAEKERKKGKDNGIRGVRCPGLSKKRLSQAKRRHYFTSLYVHTHNTLHNLALDAITSVMSRRSLRLAHVSFVTVDTERETPPKR